MNHVTHQKLPGVVPFAPFELGSVVSSQRLLFLSLTSAVGVVWACSTGRLLLLWRAGLTSLYSTVCCCLKFAVSTFTKNNLVAYFAKHCVLLVEADVASFYKVCT